MSHLGMASRPILPFYHLSLILFLWTTLMTTELYVFYYVLFLLVAIRLVCGGNICAVDLYYITICTGKVTLTSCKYVKVHSLPKYIYIYLKATTVWIFKKIIKKTKVHQNWKIFISKVICNFFSNLKHSSYIQWCTAHRYLTFISSITVDAMFFICTSFLIVPLSKLWLHVLNRLSYSTFQ